MRKRRVKRKVTILPVSPSQFEDMKKAKLGQVSKIQAARVAKAQPAQSAMHLRKHGDKRPPTSQSSAEHTKKKAKRGMFPYKT